MARTWEVLICAKATHGRPKSRLRQTFVVVINYAIASKTVLQTSFASVVTRTAA
jgi:hypothetical protein